ncbi:MAG: acyltransferase family protein [Bacteroidales bacterium]|nr:acyltransferase family protein [Bacteroidales bacterium]
MFNGGGKNNGLNKLPPQFLVKRFFRLECVLIPALGITWAFQIIGETFGHIQLYEGTYDFGGMINHNMVSSLNFKNLIGTILFLNGMAFEIQPFGCNTPLWYLPVQFWIYVMFFLSYNILVSCRRIKVFYSIILALVTLWIGEKIIFYAIVWLIGGLVPIVEKQCSEAFKGMKFLKYFGLILSLGLVLVVRVLSAGLYADMIFILSFSLLYLCMVSIGNLNGIVGLASDGLAKFSFTLYAVHFPIMATIVSLLPSFPLNLNFSLRNLSLYLSIIIIVYVFSWMVYRIFEKNTNKIYAAFQQKWLSIPLT